MSVITYPLNGVTYSANDAETYLCTRSSGVFAESGNFAASCTGEDRVVTIGTGLAWINDGDFRGKSICNDASVDLTFTAAAAANSRYCRIVLRHDRTTTPYSSYFTIIYGTDAVAPTIPDIVRDSDYYDLGLYVVYQKAGSTVITADNITSTLADSDVCGIMSDAVTDVTPETIQAQYEALLTRYQTAIRAAEDDATNAHLLKTAYIDEDEIEAIMGGGAHTTENRYLNAEGLETVWGGVEAVESRMDTLEGSYGNTAFTLAGTFTVNGASKSGKSSYTSTEGFREILLRLDETQSMTHVYFTINGVSGSKHKLKWGAEDFVDSDDYPRWVSITPLGQFVRVEQIGGSREVDAYERHYNYGAVQMLQADSTCKITQFDLSLQAASGEYSSIGTISVYTR